MARIPADELARLKSLPVADLVGRRVPLEARGADLVGVCPFHEDETPSLVVTPGKNLWHCFGCGAGGDVVAWMMKAEGVSFRHAIELLKAGAVDVVAPKTAPKLPSPLAFDADDHRLLDDVVNYYHRCLLDEPEAMAYVVEKRGLSRDVVERYRLGFCNRTLGLRLPEKNRAAGAEMRARLEQLGVFRSTGHEHFRGCITVPVVDGGLVRGLYGRKIDDGSKPHHLYLPGPHRGVFNADALSSSTPLVLCESLIDALTFLSAGVVNVTTSYGVEGFTDELLSLLQARGIDRVVIAYDADNAGDAAALKLAERLRDVQISTTRAQLPRGFDANSYALKVLPAEQSLRSVIEHATPTAATTTTTALPAVKQPAAKGEVTSAPSAAELPSSTLTLQIDDDEASATVGDRRYRIRGLARNNALDVLKINLMVARGEAFHVDTLDLYAAKQRAAFIAAASHELRCGVDVVTVHPLDRMTDPPKAAGVI
jgi:DNA primase